MFRTILTTFLLLPFACFAQYGITGKVLNTDNKKPVANASVFLSNTQSGTQTNVDGMFTLTGVKPGQYDLVISCIGYETLHKDLKVNGDIALATIEISAKTIVLNEVRIISDEERERNYQAFKNLFLGPSEFASDCKILNRDVVDISYDKQTWILSAKSDDFIEVENKALGYKIKYLLNTFSNDPKNTLFYFEGSAYFEELKGSKRQQHNWEKNRLKAYEGSSMHFLRSLPGNNFSKEGFKVLRLIRKLKPATTIGAADTYTETIVTTPLANYDFFKLTTEKGTFALSFNDCLYVMYNKKKADSPLERVFRTGDKAPPDYMTDYITTTIIFDQPYAFFDSNGIFTNPASVIFEGNWGKSRVADMLPVDYEPVIKD